VGLTQSAAIQALQEAGFGVAVFQEPGCADGKPGCPLTSGLVWRQTPVGGSVVEAGFTITLTVDP